MTGSWEIISTYGYIQKWVFYCDWKWDAAENDQLISGFKKLTAFLEILKTII